MCVILVTAVISQGNAQSKHINYTLEHITCQLCCLKTIIITSEYQECASTSIHMYCVMNTREQSLIHGFLSL